MRCFLNYKINRKGFTLVEVMVASGIVVTAIAAALGVIQYSYQFKKSIQSADRIEQYRERVMNSINSTQGWLKTIDANNISCLQAGNGGCTSTLLQEISVWDGSSTGKRLSGLGSQNIGQTAQLEECNYLDADCPFRYLVRWIPLCDTAACLNPLIRISGILEVKDSMAKAVPYPKQYDFEFMRGINNVNSKVQCDNLGGSLDLVTNRCTLPGNGPPCPTGWIVSQVQTSGQITCSPYVEISCPAGTYAKGINPDGTPICNPLASACPVTLIGTPAPPSGRDGGPVAVPVVPAGPGDAGPADAGPIMGGGGGDCGGDAGDCG